MKRFSRTYLLFGFFLFSLPAVTVQAGGNGRISGLIRSVSGSPLSDAVITIVRELKNGEALSIARTDSRGFFRSVSLTPGTYYLQVSRHGYQTVRTTSFSLDAGKSTSLAIALQNLAGLISGNDDPRNWELKTVMRSTSDRRLIFRDSPGELPMDFESGSVPFYRSGAMKIASNTALGGENYLARPQSSQSGVSSNFAIAEPLSLHSRMILSGQLDFGGGAFWRLRNTYNYRPDRDHDYKVSVGYGQMNVNYPGSTSIARQMLSQETGLRESAVRTLAVGVEGNTNFLDLLAIKYGFDYSHLQYENSKSFFYPSVQIVVHPAAGWSIQSSFASRRISDTNTVQLPDGELLNLSEPTLITMVGNHVSMSQIRHSEIAAHRGLGQNTALELAVYQDRIQGPGLPVLITTVKPLMHQSQVVEMDENHSAQRGVRMTLKQRISQALNVSVDYVYGDALNMAGIDGSALRENLDGTLGGYLQQRNQHSITGRVDATIPNTKTSILATTRWYPGNPLTPVDWFSDRMDIGTKSTNFEVRQVIPLPEFMTINGRWEILVDLRNVLNQGKEVLQTNDGVLILNRNPRSLRFGLSLSFR